MSEKTNNTSDEYYIGLDCGTNSVGWAVTNAEYHLLRAKGKTLYGVRLFDEASTAAERRTHRSSRRRLDRANNRLKLLRMLFSDEMAKIDRDFYQRLDESFYLLEDKQGLGLPSSNTLFNDDNYKDKDFHKTYPTIWHLRQAIVHASKDEHFDLRLYFLAIQHILKHRGHFLREGEIRKGAGNFDDIYNTFQESSENAGLFVRSDIASRVKSILCDKTTGKLDKKKSLAELLYDEDAAVTSADESHDGEYGPTAGYKELAGLLTGSSVSVVKALNIETDNDELNKLKISTDFDLEEKYPDLATQISPEQLDVIFAAKAIHDYEILSDLLGNNEYISDAMVSNYDCHHNDLSVIKQALKPYPEDYKYFFNGLAKIDDNRIEVDEKRPCYPMYIGKGYSATDTKGRRKHVTLSQADFNKAIQKLVKQHNIILPAALAGRLESGELFPKQKGQAKGTIPQQLHHNELELILERLQRDYPSFATENPNESDKYNTKSKKIAFIHNFRIPYYCGPLKQRKYSEDGRILNPEGSAFSWADEEIRQIVYPWNFDELVDKNQCATNFITRMTGDCSYLIGEKVLPKSSLLYQKYITLNEINNLKINGNRITDHDLKLRIYNEFVEGNLSGNVSIRKLEQHLKNLNIISSSDELSGISEGKFLPKLTTHRDFTIVLGDNYAKKYTSEQLETTIQAITILGDERKMLKQRVQEILSCGEDTAQRLAKLSYKDWGKFSARLLQGIRNSINGHDMTILEALEATERNFMELLGGDNGFQSKIDDFNRVKKPAITDISYQDIQNLYCSPAVKRSIWQAVRIVKEIVAVRGSAPTRIFLEATRGDDKKQVNGNALKRKNRLQVAYNDMSGSNGIAELINELNSKEDRDLQQKKLYLYFCQMGRCAYSGHRIDIENLATDAYDIDHIYPRSYTKDDSLERNLVLVEAKLNREKTNIYPISGDIRSRMAITWASWKRAKLITKEKYERLIRSTQLTDDELGGFIARQIVETSQAVKAIKQIFAEAYPKTKVILVKAGQVSDFRRLYGQDHKDRAGRVYRAGRPEFIKLRELNDYHHAQDAYLNIVVGDTMNRTFTDDPRKWLKARSDRNYSIKTELLFRENEKYENPKTGKTQDYPHMKGWNYATSLDIVSRTLLRNNVLWTRMPIEQTGQLSDLQIVGKLTDAQAKTEGISPIKQSSRLAQIAKYGGYNSAKGAFFALIEQDLGKKGIHRRIIQIPITHSRNIAKYVEQNYPDATVLIDKINFKSALKYNGFPMHLTGRTGGQIKFYPAIQIFISPQLRPALKRILNVSAKIKETANKKQEYTISDEDGINANENIAIFNELCAKLQQFFRTMPTLGGRVEEIVNSSNQFRQLSLPNQCLVIVEMLNLMGCNAMAGDLTKLIPKSEHLGWGSFSSNITSADVKLIHQSPTGLFSYEIDLNDFRPGEYQLSQGQ